MAIREARSGVELTDALIERLAERAEAGFDLPTRPNPGGRPSLGAGVSPRVQFRVDATTFQLLLDRAEREDRGVSEIAREALERYLRGDEGRLARAAVGAEASDEPAVAPGLVGGRRVRPS